jgi:hypothetical protein
MEAAAASLRDVFLMDGLADRTGFDFLELIARAFIVGRARKKKGRARWSPP